jgi:H+/Cl- antiporter ClcA
MMRSAFANFLDHPLLSGRVWLRGVVFWAGALAVSAMAIGLARAATGAEALFGHAVAFNRFAPFVLTPAGLAVATWLTRQYFPGAQGSGIPQVIAATTMRDPASVARLLSPRVALGKLALTLMGLLCGASIGREGPTVQIGAAVMRGLGRLAGVSSSGQMRALVLAGGAAGVAAAFNTPLAGVVFTIEELSRSFDARTSGAVMTAVIVAGIATVALTGGGSYFGHTGATLPVGTAWFAVVVCAVLGGLSGGLFARLLIAMASLPGWIGRFASQRPAAFAATCGLVLAALGVGSHGATYGTGYAQARAMVAGHYGLPLDFFALKFGATLVSYASGVPGGIFAPSLAVGAGLGRAVAFLLPHAPAGAVVLLGMVAYFSGVVQAPLTAAVIVMEMTDSQDMKIPLMAASFLAFGVSRLVCKRALYGVLARRLVETLEAKAPAVSGVLMDEDE